MRVVLSSHYYHTNTIKLPQDQIPETDKIVFEGDMLPYPMPLSLDRRGRVFGCKDLFLAINAQPEDQLELEFSGERARILAVLPPMPSPSLETSNQGNPTSLESTPNTGIQTAHDHSILLRKSDGSLHSPVLASVQTGDGPRSDDQSKRFVRSTLTQTSMGLYLLFHHLGNDVPPGKVTLVFEDRPDWVFEGHLNPRGTITGLSKMFKTIGAVEGIVLEYEWNLETRTLRILQVLRPSGATPTTIAPMGRAARRAKNLKIAKSPAIDLKETVFTRRRLRYVLLQRLDGDRPLATPPVSAQDVMARFLLVQKTTPYEWVCAPDDDLLARLGYPTPLSARSRPDAILLERKTQELLMAAFHVRSSDFARQRDLHDFDVLIAWEDDLKKPASLPARRMFLSIETAQRP